MTTEDPNHPSAERIERLQRRRTRLLFMQAIIFLLWQTSFFARPLREAATARGVDHVKIGAYIVWAAALVLFVATGGGYIQPKAVRRVLNDELTIDHRRRAMTAGFLASMMAAVICYFIDQFLGMPAGVAIHTILTVGVAAALLRFAMLERRAQADG
jgi:hypothetical protein